MLERAVRMPSNRPEQLRLRAFWDYSGHATGCPACELGTSGRKHTVACKARQKAYFAAHGEPVFSPRPGDVGGQEQPDEVKEELPEEPTASTSPLRSSLKKRKTEMKTEEAEEFKAFREFGEEEPVPDPIAISSGEDAPQGGGGATGSGLRRPREDDDGGRPPNKSRLAARAGIKREPEDDRDNARKYRQLDAILGKTDFPDKKLFPMLEEGEETEP